jgi:hypothetical protein
MKKSPSDPTSAAQRRKEPRVPTHLPVVMNGKKGIAKDISASGIYFELDEKQKVGSTIHFSIEMDTPGGQLMFVCEGKVIRAEEADGKVKIAAKIIRQEFQNADSNLNNQSI